MCCLCKIFRGCGRKRRCCDKNHCRREDNFLRYCDDFGGRDRDIDRCGCDDRRDDRCGCNDRRNDRCGCGCGEAPMRIYKGKI